MEQAIKKIEKVNGCWNWLGHITKKGYGRFDRFGKRVMVHRYFYENLVGPILKGLEIDHLCRNRKCMNPKHLEPVTHRENLRREWIVRIKNTPNCKYGHPYLGNNLNIVTNKKLNKTFRTCRMCKSKVNKEYTARRKANSLQLV